MSFTATQKKACAEREVKQRQRVYPNLMESGRMTREFADEQIRIMQEIAADYAKQEAAEKLI